MCHEILSQCLKAFRGDIITVGQCEIIINYGTLKPLKLIKNRYCFLLRYLRTKYYFQNTIIV